MKKDDPQATRPVVTALSSSTPEFVRQFMDWVYSLSTEQYMDLRAHAECVWNHILQRPCAVEESVRSGWHATATTSDHVEPRLPDGWGDLGNIPLNSDPRIVEEHTTKDARHSDIVADLVLERRAMRPAVKTESVDELKDLGQRKALGSFYTPAAIVDYMVEKTVGRKLPTTISDQAARSITIVDPSCGDGNFLIGAAEYLLAWWWLRLGRDVSAVERARIIREQLFGVDIDPAGVAGCRKNLATIAGCEPDDIHNVRCGNSLIGIKQTTAEEFAKLGPYPSRDAYDQMLLNEFAGMKIKKEVQKWDPAKKKTVTTETIAVTIEDIRELNPFHWEFEFPQIFTPGHASSQADRREPRQALTSSQPSLP